ncbi:MAG: hypothetical protein OIF50_13535 [Flavobacteriaceae bacterium]|nr:hypothetical protein [Flavobacteriaceae bacterium]
MKPHRHILCFTFALLAACASDESTSMVPAHDDVMLSNSVLRKINYPDDNQGLAYSRANQKFVYDDLNQLAEIHFGPLIYTVNYVHDNQIALNLVQHDLQNLKWSDTKLLIFKDNNLNHILTYSKFTSKDYRIESKDSISLWYQQGYLTEIRQYSKILHPEISDYQQYKQINFRIEDGNRVAAHIEENGQNQKKSFTFDQKSYLPFSDFALESPVYFGFYQLLIHDKLGKNNKNNIRSVCNASNDSLYAKDRFEFIQYQYEIDDHHRLKSIAMLGTTSALNPDLPQKEFVGQKTYFDY